MMMFCLLAMIIPNMRFLPFCKFLTLNTAEYYAGSLSFNLRMDFTNNVEKLIQRIFSLFIAYSYIKSP